METETTPSRRLIALKAVIPCIIYALVILVVANVVYLVVIEIALSLPNSYGMARIRTASYFQIWFALTIWAAVVAAIKINGLERSTTRKLIKAIDIGILAVVGWLMILAGPTITVLILSRFGSIFPFFQWLYYWLRY